MDHFIFNCSICDDKSREICVFCTKDACTNHLCLRCRRCSDCCECEMPLTGVAPQIIESEAVSSSTDAPLDPEPALASA
jgi:hypothetical protein